MQSIYSKKRDNMSDCILCGTEIEENFCYECDAQAQIMGLDYESLIGAI